MPDPSDNGEVLRFLAASVESIRLKVEEMNERMATKDDIARIYEHMATKDDIARMATKDDITVVRGDIERLDLRLDGIDRAVTLRMDTMDLSISRLRSAVYLLARDQPEIQKLLGQA
jgi:hypothetical protein